MMGAFPAPKAIHHHPLRFRRFFNTGGSHAQIALCEHHIGVLSCCARCRRWTSSARAGAPHRHEIDRAIALLRTTRHEDLRAGSDSFNQSQKDTPFTG